MEDSNTIILKDYNKFNSDLAKQITHNELRQQEIQSLISDVNNSNIHIKNVIQQETDSKKRASYYGILNRNIELLAKLYSTYREFEGIKHQYFKEIGTMIHQSKRLIYVDLPKKNVDGGYGEEFRNMLKALSGITKNMPERQSEKSESKSEDVFEGYKL